MIHSIAMYTLPIGESNTDADSITDNKNKMKFYLSVVNKSLISEFDSILQSVIKKYSLSNDKTYKSYMYDKKYTIHILMMSDHKYLTVITNITFDKKYILELFEDITITINECNSQREIQQLLNTKLTECSKHIDKFSQIQHGIDDTKKNTTDNINKLSTQGEMIGGMVDKTDGLDEFSKKLVVKTKNVVRCIIS